MVINSLQIFTAGVSSIWGPLSSELVAGCHQRLEQLVQTRAEEEWLAALLHTAPAAEELYRDADHGFVLLAHAEAEGLYRPPHDHGRGWVIYGMIQGESEMGTYARVADADGMVKLVKRNETLVRPGQVQVYLPGDIHDTRCVRGPALLFRFTERDLKSKDEAPHVARYVQLNGNWIAQSA